MLEAKTKETTDSNRYCYECAMFGYDVMGSAVCPYAKDIHRYSVACDNFR